MNACTKKSYGGYRPAIRELRKIRARADRNRRDRHSLPNHAYRCPVCGCWHLTSLRDRTTSRRKGR